MSFFADLKRRKVFRVAAAYVIASWLLIQVVETIFPAFGFGDAAIRILVVVLAIGLVPVVIIAWALGMTLENQKVNKDVGFTTEDHLESAGRLPEPDSAQRPLSGILKQPRFAVPLVLALVAALGAIGVIGTRAVNSRSARLEVLPEIIRLLEQDEYTRAYALAEDVENYLSDDPVFVGLWPTFSVHTSIQTQPNGVEVFIKDSSTSDDDWTSLGRTPIESVRLPRTVLRWRFEKEGFETAERLEETFGGTFRLRLLQGSLPPNMVRVPTTKPYFVLIGFNPPEYEVPQFVIDRYEVTNREFLEFVESGEYGRQDFWEQLTFMADGEEISWEDAMAQFRDPTGRPGPSTWQGGTFPKGEADYPVRGVSWFEAAAYAAFREKELPTIYEWSSAASMPAWEEAELQPGEVTGLGAQTSELVKLSNISSADVAAVGSYDSFGPHGTYDMAGNIREWCWNATETSSGSDRYILGGAWNDPSYLYTYGVAQSPWDRSETNGFRLVQHSDRQELVATLKQPVELPVQEQIPPISDEIFQVYRDLYDYDRTALNVVVESVSDKSTLWTQEIVSFDATYGDDRIMAHIFLPKNIEPPYQVVAYYPSSDGIFTSTSDDLEISRIDFIIMSGRAVVYPILMGTYERNIGLDTTWPKNTRAYTNHVVQWIQDFTRTIDYLETRDDLNLDRLGFNGYSWGGWNGPIVLALDDRFKTGVFVSGGIPPTLARPEASSASFASRVKVPVLMISGKHDILRPVATFQKPMFDSLGTPDEYKRHAILDGGHSPPRNQLIRETLDWLDQYLGPVN